MIQEKVLEFRRQQPPYPRNSNYMSDIGHGCERYLVYSRTHWDKKAPISDRLRAIFKEGQIHEDAILDELRRAGLKVTNQQVRLFDDDLKLSGKLDAVVEDLDNPGQLYLVEVKSMSPYIFDSIERYEDMLGHKSFWVKHYPAQMQCYLYYYREKFNLQPQGLFLLKNKVTGWLKEIPVEYDESLALDLMLRAERINRHVAEKTLPARVPVHMGLCEECDFRLICMPDQELGPGAQFIDDAELLGLLRRREELKLSVQEYERLDTLIKKQFKGDPGMMIVLGEFVIEPVSRHKDAYAVKPQDYVEVKIRRRLEAVDTEQKQA